MVYTFLTSDFHCNFCSICSFLKPQRDRAFFQEWTGTRILSDLKYAFKRHCIIALIIHEMSSAFTSAACIQVILGDARGSKQSEP